MAGLLALLAVEPVVNAAPPPLSVPISSEDTSSGAPGGIDGFLSSLNRSNFLLGDLFGVRTFLSRYGASLAIQETSEVLGNATGGAQKGAEYDGLTQAILQLDTQRAFGHYGGLFNVSALQVHGRNFSADNLGSIQTSSGIEADRSTRLWELWYDQKFLEENRLDIKVGQQSLDQEFIVSSNALYFVNTMFGWPALTSYDLPGGGPAYPLSALGVRARLRPIDSVNVLVGAFNGSPVRNNGADAGDPQQQNASGTSFPLSGGALVFTELQYAYPSIGSMVYPGEAAPLARTYRIGGWYDSERFSDQRRDDNGLSLADPASDGVAARHRGNYSIYAVADQMMWRNQIDPNNSLSAFGRVMGAPQGDRNLIGFSANAGLIYHEPFRYRPDDTFGLGMGYASVTSDVSGLDRDTGSFATPGTYSPVRSSETYVEATYQYQVRPWMQLQPDVQYIVNPGAGIVDPNNANRRVGNEFVIGLRANILI
jgi:porin